MEKNPINKPIKNEDGLIDPKSVKHKIEIRRLLCNRLQPAQNRTYTGVCLNEENPSPRYVYIDSEIPITGDLPFDSMA